MKHSHTNHLINATSPYLLQHAHNPVEWYEWGAEALAKSKREDKPILVSIGYSSCHWCHVMERECFESEKIAKVMNDFFVCIKVDREERPDIDQIYMEAVQALGVNGGWPLNVFLTVDQKPFFGGTYFTPPAWVQVLNNIHLAFSGNRDQLEHTAEELSQHLMNSDVARFIQPPAATAWLEDMDAIYAALEPKFDREWGGMARAPKFIMPSIWRFLLRYHHASGNSKALAQVTLTLDKIAQGGIYDQLRGGFARYSVDGLWFAPHFEKMLYDNAQLLSLYAEAYAVTKDNTYKQVVIETFEWLLNEMTHPKGGFYSALDADSEGSEGKYYVWTKKELEEVLGKDEPVISAFYQATPEGNWEDGNNILHLKDREGAFVSRNGLSDQDWQIMLSTAKSKLLKYRERRIKPGLDDKILTAWNAMTVCGLVDAFNYLQDGRFLDAAVSNMNFIISELSDDTILYRSYKGKRSNTQGFLDDYAYTIQATIKLYQASFDESWLGHATRFTTYALDHFFDEKEKFFHYTASSAERLISRKKEIFDNVIPSSNAIMVQNLFILGTLLDREEWKEAARQMTSSLSTLIRTEPNYMSQWAIALTEIKKGFKEVLIVGPNCMKLGAEIQKDFHPFIVVQGAISRSDLPLFEGKEALDGIDMIYVCENKACQLPVRNLRDARRQF
ncbi:MAG: thioredoxin domain-containing protein [Chryseolinea sp.]